MAFMGESKLNIKPIKCPNCKHTITEFKKVCPHCEAEIEYVGGAYKANK